VQIVHRLWLNLRKAPEMHDLHHSDVISYALTRMASEFTRDREGTLQGLRTSIQEQNTKQRLGGPRFDAFETDELDYSEAGEDEPVANDPRLVS
jgi:hypothetical protein